MKYIDADRQQAEEGTLGKTLDEAAEEYDTKLPFEGELYVDDGYIGDGWSIDSVIAAFKAGAKWMAGQGAQLIGRIKVNGMGQPYLPPEYIYLSGLDLKEGDKVIVQIRKKEESK